MRKETKMKRKLGTEKKEQFLALFSPSPIFTFSHSAFWKKHTCTFFQVSLQVYSIMPPLLCL